MSYINPLILQRADPHMSKGPDGYYYFTASVPEYNRIELRRAKTIQALSECQTVDVWYPPEQGKYSSLIWAPELHYLFGQWIIYFAAAPNREIINGLFQHRMYAIGCSGHDPMKDPWEFLGQVDSQLDSFCLDATHFYHHEKHYYIWAQKDPLIEGNSNLYIALLSSPTQLASKPVMLSYPEYDWEKNGFSVNEGPAILIRNHKVILTYSASATDENYCLGMLWADENADLLIPGSWHKTNQPIFTTCNERKIFGPGHNSFVVDENGCDLLIYHARNYTDIQGDPLWDPNRHTRVQQIQYDQAGLLSLGQAC
ncbi:family 43 glycosylhydrolase [Celerinatantimonas sp. YJH-8]|uniref:family 43 glycosylhydrolase n=1 Tax=Celerinatantimonas sp. YJH-8 TaxID=3228714 RepID=UPI0038C49B6F